MEQINTQTIGQLVANDYRTAEVFRTFKIDFCCGGNKTVQEACKDSGVDYNEVLKALQHLENVQSVNQQNYNDWSLDFLVDYIINNHHKFSRSKLPEIGAYTKKVSRVHGDRHPELKQISYEFTRLHEEMTAHLDKEEGSLFPYIKELVEARKQERTPEKPDFQEAANPIARFEQEHDEAGAIMKKIRNLSNDFTPPDDACTTYRLLFKNLEALEMDLHKHVHLENNILFPKAAELEKSFHMN